MKEKKKISALTIVGWIGTAIFVVAIGITSDNGAPFISNVLAGITLFAVFVGSYLILDVLFWVIVYKKWLK